MNKTLYSFLTLKGRKSLQKGKHQPFPYKNFIYIYSTEPSPSATAKVADSEKCTYLSPKKSFVVLLKLLH
jgi:hypothetical protein